MKYYCPWCDTRAEQLKHWNSISNAIWKVSCVRVDLDIIAHLVRAPTTDQTIQSTIACGIDSMSVAVSCAASSCENPYLFP